MKISSDSMWYGNNELALGYGQGEIYCSNSVVYAGNAMDIMLTHDHADNSSLFLRHIKSLAISTLPPP